MLYFTSLKIIPQSNPFQVLLNSNLSKIITAKQTNDFTTQKCTLGEKGKEEESNQQELLPFPDGHCTIFCILSH